MRITPAILFAMVFCTAVPNANVVKQVADEVLPVFEQAVDAAAIASADMINKLIQKDIHTWLKKTLFGIPILPDRAQERCATATINLIVKRISDAITRSVQQYMPSRIKPIMNLLKTELYRVDKGLTRLLEDFRFHLLQKYKLDRRIKPIKATSLLTGTSPAKGTSMRTGKVSMFTGRLTEKY